MAMSNRDRVGKMFELAAPVIDAFLQQTLKEQLPTVPSGRCSWRPRTAEGRRQQGVRPPDPQVQLRMLTENIPHQPQAGLVPVRRRDRPRRAGRTRSELREARNDWAHNKSVHRRRRLPLPRHRRAAARSRSARRRWPTRSRRSGSNLRRVTADKDDKKVLKSAAVTPESAGLRPWREVLAAARRRRHRQLPGRRVRRRPLQGRRDRQDAGKDYADPVEFFARTYLTEGLRDLIGRAVRRLAGDDNASPVINLQTNFGGGKTHSMLALWHLASGTPLGDFPQEVQELLLARRLRRAGRGVRRVAHRRQPHSARRVRSRPTAPRSTRSGASWPGSSAAPRRTRWSRPRTPTAPTRARRCTTCSATYAPGRDPDRRVGRLRAQPRRARRPGRRDVRRPVHLRPVADRGGQGHARGAAGDLDPRVGERRRRPDRSPATPRRSAARTASRRSSGCRTSCAASPTSGGPASSERGLPHRPAAAVRRSPTPTRSRRSTRRPAASSRCTASHADDFPREARDGGYEDRIKQTYPIHPELFDRLYEDWSSLERFQRTRGVLRLMNTVIHALWVGEDQSPLIMPGVDPARDRGGELRADAVPAGLVEGGHRRRRRRPELRAGADRRRASRCSGSGRSPGASRAPCSSAPPRRIGSAHKGLETQRVFLGTAIPGDVPATSTPRYARSPTARRTSTARAASTGTTSRPTSPRRAKDQAERLHNEDVWAEIAERLEGQAQHPRRVRRRPRLPGGRGRHPRHRRGAPGHPAPQGHAQARRPTTPTRWRSPRGATEHRGTANRTHRNMLVYLAGDARPHRGARHARCASTSAGRTSSPTRTTSTSPRASATRRPSGRAKASETTDARLLGAYQWALVPAQADPKLPFTITATKAEGQTTSLAERASKKLGTEGQLTSQLGPATIRFALDNKVPASWEAGHVKVGELWQLFARYPYMIRLRNRSVLDDGLIQQQSTAWQYDGFALADGYDETSGRYRGLILPQISRPSPLPTTH